MKNSLPKGIPHYVTKITIECMDAKVPMKLVDNGFTINLCPIRTALKVGLDIENIIPSLLTSKAYDNTSRKVMGTFKATCKIGLLNSIVEFHVMDITSSYKLLLGKAWLFPIGAIPSTLHQKIKILWKGVVAVIHGDWEILALVCEVNIKINEFQRREAHFQG